MLRSSSKAGTASCLRQRIKRLRVWVFLFRTGWVGIDRSIILISLFVWTAFLYIVFNTGHRISDGPVGHDIDGVDRDLLARIMSRERKSRLHQHGNELKGLPIHDSDAENLPLQPQKQQKVWNKAKEVNKQQQHRHVPKGFYKKGFDAVGENGHLTPEKLRDWLTFSNRSGSTGSAVKLSKVERRRAESHYEEWGFNVVASQKVRVTSRTLTLAQRDAFCALSRYPTIDSSVT